MIENVLTNKHYICVLQLYQLALDLSYELALKCIGLTVEGALRKRLKFSKFSIFIEISNGKTSEKKIPKRNLIN